MIGNLIKTICLNGNSKDFNLFFIEHDDRSSQIVNVDISNNPIGVLQLRYVHKLTHPIRAGIGNIAIVKAKITIDMYQLKHH